MAEELGQLEQDYKEGMLTRKGYKRKRLNLELTILQQELDNGDITTQGYNKKRIKIQNLYGEECETNETSVEVAQRLSNPGSKEQVHSVLAKLFNKKKTNSSTTCAERKKSLKCTFKKRFITVLLLPSNCTKLPKEKTKQELRQRGHMKSCEISECDTSENIVFKIKSCFPELEEGFKYISATVSGDLFDVEDTVLDGKAVLDMCGNGSLMIRPIKATINTQTAASTEVSSITSSQPTTSAIVVNPQLSFVKNSITSPHSTVFGIVLKSIPPVPTTCTLASSNLPQSTPPTPSNFLQTSTKSDLFDNFLFHLIKYESLLHVPKNDVNQQVNIPLDLNKGEFLLNINLEVYHWFLYRKYLNIVLPRKVDYFYIMNEDLMKHFEDFKSTNPVEILNDTLLPDALFLPLYLHQNGLPVKKVIKYAMTFVRFPLNKIDDLCDWIEDKRSSY